MLRRFLIGPDHLARNRNELRWAFGRSARQGEVRNAAGPGQVLKNRIASAQIVCPESFVSSDRDRALKVRYRSDLAEAVIATEPSVSRPADESAEGVLLNVHRVHSLERSAACVR